MSRDLFCYLSLKRYITVNHSGQNHIKGNKTTAITSQFIGNLLPRGINDFMRLAMLVNFLLTRISLHTGL